MPHFRAELKPWDVGTRFADAALGRLLRAVVECGGQVLDSYVHDFQGYQGNQKPVEFRIKLPVGTEAKFREISRMELAEPPVFEGSVDG